jgi:hypothetical protein
MSDKDKNINKNPDQNKRPPEESKFTLKGEKQKRKTQEILNLVEQKKIEQSRRGGTGPLGAAKEAMEASQAAAEKRSSQTMNGAAESADTKRTSQTMSAAQRAQSASRTSQSMPAAGGAKRATQSTPGAKRASQTIPFDKRATQFAGQVVTPAKQRYRRLTQKEIIGLAALAIVAVCVILGMYSTNPPTTNTISPTFPPLPLVTTSNVVERLKSVGVPLSNFLKIDTPSPNWHAKEGMQFTVQRGGEKGIFIILSYTAVPEANREAFRVSVDPKWSRWKSTVIANVLLMSSPDTATSIRTELGSHLIQYLVAPYRYFMPTATPGPTLAGTQPATQPASG